MEDKKLRRFAAALIGAIVVVIAIAGCASTPGGLDDDRVAGDGTIEGMELLESNAETTETLVYRGVTVSAPVGYHFENAYGTVRSTTSWDRPYGVLVRLRSRDATVRGSIEFVYFADDYDVVEYLDDYRDEYLSGTSGSTVAFRGGDEPVYGTIVSGSMSGSDASGSDASEVRDTLVALYPMTGRVSRESAVLLVLTFPSGNETSRREAIAIANSLEAPGARNDMRIHARFSSGQDRTSYEDRSGRWRWVTDVPGGFIVQAIDSDGDIFLMVADGETLSSSRPGVIDATLGNLIDTGVTVAVDRGAWRWSVPMGAVADDQRHRFLSIPPDPDTDSGAIVVFVSTPGRVWRDGQTRVQSRSDQRVAIALENFIAWRLDME
jgi:hypothetical protein